jgi:hypothetical protein
MAQEPLAFSLSDPPAAGNDPQAIARQFFLNKGLTQEQATGVVRRLNIESGLGTGAFNPTGGGQGAYGIAQWRGPRQQALLASSDPHSLQGQLNFAWSELQGPESKTLAQLKQAKTEQQAYDTWTSSYERPGPTKEALGFSQAAAGPAGGGGPSGAQRPSGGLLDAFLGSMLAQPEEAKPAAPPSLLDEFLGSLKKPMEPEAAAPQTATRSDSPQQTPAVTPPPSVPLPEQAVPTLAQTAQPPAQGGLLDRFLASIKPESFAGMGALGAEAASGVKTAAQAYEKWREAGPEMTPGHINQLAQGFGTDAGGGFVGSIGRGPGMTRLPASQAAGAMDLARGVSHEIQSVFSPTTIDQPSRMAEASIRKDFGQANRDTESAHAELEPYWRSVAPHIAPFQQYVQQTHAAVAAGLPLPPKSGLANFLDYVEGRSSGATLPPDIAYLKPVADTLRKQVQDRAAKISADPLYSAQTFVQDYFSHQWTDPQAAATKWSGSGRGQGSTAPLKQRSIPTITEGIERGLTPRYDPIEMQMRYIANIDRLLAHNKVFQTGLSSGMIRYFDPGQQPAGWMKLEGRLSEKGIQRAYAPEGYARVYNRSSHIAPGLMQFPIFRAAMAIKNAANMTLLSLSGYHYMAMAGEALTSKFARAFGNLSPADWGRLAKTLGSTADITQIGQIAKGKRLANQYLRLADNGPEYERIADNLASARGRAIGRGEEWKASQASTWFQAWRRGMLRVEMRQGLREITSGPASTAPLRAGAMFFHEVARAAESIQEPLFDQIIPNLKNAAFFDEMSDWIRRNPGASKFEEIAQARSIADSIDDRFGLMVMDNIFWNQKFKQILQLLMVSPGWELGSLRGQAGGLWDLARGKVTPRARWLIGLTIATPLINGVYEYLKTGQSPLQTGTPARDLTVPQTGGQTPEGAPERAIFPGYEKDPLGWWNDPMSKIFGMQSPFIRAAGMAITGKDWKGDRIANPQMPGAPPFIQSYAQQILQAVEPILLQQLGKRQPGSGISLPETIMGIRPAPGWLTDPKRTETLQNLRDIRDAERAVQSERYQARRSGDYQKQHEATRKLEQLKQKYQRERRNLPRSLPPPPPQPGSVGPQGGTIIGTQRQ